MTLLMGVLFVCFFKKFRVQVYGFRSCDKHHMLITVYRPCHMTNWDWLHQIARYLQYCFLILMEK